jgi:2-polyprenyl-3-methyl-5-hydroxy-6-metoxy-1,4-benzoquinol methylase
LQTIHRNASTDQALPRTSRRFQLRERRLQPEIMDDPKLDEARHYEALRGLSRLNLVGKSARLIWPTLVDLSRNVGRTIRVLDIATGAGDVPLALGKLARRHGVAAEFAGCDISSRAIEYARRQATQADVPIDFFTCDALHDNLPTGYDAIICSLFLHHLQREQALNLLRRMADACSRLVVVSDLNRTRSTMFITRMASLLVTRSDVVHVDGPRSVQAAFSVAEAKQLTLEAGLAACSIRSAWPCRFLITWQRPTEK